MKKILLLGGSAQQIIAIKAAKKMGFYTILCDYLSDNPGQFVADKFYLKSTTDKEAILEIAKNESIDGILAYASDPAAPTAAYVSEQLNLPGNPYQSVEILCNKDRFRKFLLDNGFNSPSSIGYSSEKEAMDDAMNFEYPLIVKPVDSSGSKGVTVLYNANNLNEAVEKAFSFSRSKRIIIEQFIDKKHPYLVGGDIFVVDGKIELYGLLNCHRDNNVNPLVPVGKSYPLELEEKDIQNVKVVLSRIISSLKIKNGSLNVELVVDKDGNIWPIDIGPRSGGNMIPDLLGDMFGVDIAELSVKVAMGEHIEMNTVDPVGCYATHNLHSRKNGQYVDILFEKELQKYIYRTCFYKKPGDKVECFDNASKCLGIIFMKFNNQEEMKEKLELLDDLIHINVE